MPLANHQETVRRRLKDQLIDSFTPEQRRMWNALRIVAPRGRLERRLTRLLDVLAGVDQLIPELNKHCAA